MSIFVIAEVGINHNGDLALARKLIDVAADAGANAVKFQKRTLELVYTAEELDKPRESPWGTTTRQQKAGLEFGPKEYEAIAEHCREREIEWFASAWDLESQAFLKRFPTRYNKIASPRLGHMKLLQAVADEGKHTFISTGMANYSEIDAAVELFRKSGCSFELMHCTSTYPSTPEELNLRCIQTLRDRYKCDIGYSGHEVGLNTTLAAAALGATSIERHITLDRSMYGSDQAASVEPGGLSRLVRDIRAIEKALGDGEKRIWPSEEPIAAKLKRSEDFER